MQDPLSEDENEDIHHVVEYSILESNTKDIHNAVEYTILESNSAEMTLSEDENEDIHHAVEYSILQTNSAEMDFVGEKLKLVFELQAELFNNMQSMCYYFVFSYKSM